MHMHTRAATKARELSWPHKHARADRKVKLGAHAYRAGAELRELSWAHACEGCHKMLVEFLFPWFRFEFSCTNFTIDKLISMPFGVKIYRYKLMQYFFLNISMQIYTDMYAFASTNKKLMSLQ